MKKIQLLFSLFALVLFSGSSFAQDIITLKSGEDVKAKILEVGINEVKYKKFDNEDGPSYTVPKSDVFMIKYQNGSKDVFNTTNNNAAPSNPAPAANPAPVQSNPSVNSYENKAKTEKEINNVRAQEEYDRNNRIFKSRLRSGIVCTSLGVPFLVGGISLASYGGVLLTESSYDTYDTFVSEGAAFLAVGCVLSAVGIPLTIIGPIKIGSSFKYKRMANQAKANISFEPHASPFGTYNNGNHNMGMSAGIGMKLKF